jgi:hypothetical protein
MRVQVRRRGGWREIRLSLRRGVAMGDVCELSFISGLFLSSRDLGGYDGRNDSGSWKRKC